MPGSRWRPSGRLLSWTGPTAGMRRNQQGMPRQSLKSSDWMRMTRLANFRTAHDELEWLYHAQDVPEKCMGCGDPEGVRQRSS